MIQENTLTSEKEMLDRLASRKDLYSPLEIRSLKPQVSAADRGFGDKLGGRPSLALDKERHDSAAPA